MPSEYDPIGQSGATIQGDDDLDRVRHRFERAGRPYLSSPWSWVSWAVILPTTALVTPFVVNRWGPVSVLFLWSTAILLGGGVEMSQIVRGRTKRGPSTSLAAWVLRIQGNLSLVGLALSALLVAQNQSWVLPALWLLLLGHSFYVVGGLAFPPLRVTGMIFQVGGVIALWPRGSPLVAFAVTTLVGCLWIAWGIRQGSANQST